MTDKPTREECEAILSAADVLNAPKHALPPAKSGDADAAPFQGGRY